MCPRLPAWVWGEICNKWRRPGSPVKRVTHTPERPEATLPRQVLGGIGGLLLRDQRDPEEGEQRRGALVRVCIAASLGDLGLPCVVSSGGAHGSRIHARGWQLESHTQLSARPAAFLAEGPGL